MIPPSAQEKRTRRLAPEQFDSWKSYYWAYQYRLAIRFYIPLLEEWGIELTGVKVLDVGCGNGGFVAGFADRGARCTGVEIRDFNWQPHAGVRFVVADITTEDARRTVGTSFDLIVLRDVIEHIPRGEKASFLKILNGFKAPSAPLFVTFPPYYSPFGLHQQTVLKSPLRRIPFLHLLPRQLIFCLLRVWGESQEAERRIAEVIECRMTIRHFRQIIQELDMAVKHERFYLVRPSHEIRYGWKTRTLKTKGTAPVDEMRILGTAFLLGLRT
jgi:SAM-dependent methyltransferase